MTSFFRNTSNNAAHHLPNNRQSQQQQYKHKCNCQMDFLLVMQIILILIHMGYKEHSGIIIPLLMYRLPPPLLLLTRVVS
jgi:hypothetical protein